MKLVKLLGQFIPEKASSAWRSLKKASKAGRSDYVVAPDLSSAGPREKFFEFARNVESSASVLEIGTKQAKEGFSTHSQNYFPNVARKNYIMADVFSGPDVDIIANLHALPAEWSEKFDCFVANAVFEHLERPWVAAKEVARVLKIGGGCYVATHQTFPLHGYPSDFFRFSTEALALIFEDAGLEVIEVAYEHRAKIIPPANIVKPRICEQWNATWPSYIVVHIFAKKTK